MRLIFSPLISLPLDVNYVIIHTFLTPSFTALRSVAFHFIFTRHLPQPTSFHFAFGDIGVAGLRFAVTECTRRRIHTYR